MIYCNARKVNVSRRVFPPPPPTNANDYTAILLQDIFLCDMRHLCPLLSLPFIDTTKTIRSFVKQKNNYNAASSKTVVLIHYYCYCNYYAQSSRKRAIGPRRSILHSCTIQPRRMFHYQTLVIKQYFFGSSLRQSTEF